MKCMKIHKLAVRKSTPKDFRVPSKMFRRWAEDFRNLLRAALTWDELYIYKDRDQGIKSQQLRTGHFDRIANHNKHEDTHMLLLVFCCKTDPHIVLVPELEHGWPIPHWVAWAKQFLDFLYKITESVSWRTQKSKQQDKKILTVSELVDFWREIRDKRQRDTDAILNILRILLKALVCDLLAHQDGFQHGVGSLFCSCHDPDFSRVFSWGKSAT